VRVCGWMFVGGGERGVRVCVVLEALGCGTTNGRVGGGVETKQEDFELFNFGFSNL
jgi:hypothetical protein